MQNKILLGSLVKIPTPLTYTDTHEKPNNVTVLHKKTQISLMASAKADLGVHVNHEESVSPLLPTEHPVCS